MNHSFQPGDLVSLNYKGKRTGLDPFEDGTVEAVGENLVRVAYQCDGDDCVYVFHHDFLKKVRGPTKKELDAAIKSIMTRHE